jgi:hypothetical protein
LAREFTVIVVPAAPPVTHSPASLEEKALLTYWAMSHSDDLVLLLERDPDLADAARRRTGRGVRALSGPRAQSRTSGGRTGADATAAGAADCQRAAGEGGVGLRPRRADDEAGSAKPACEDPGFSPGLGRDHAVRAGFATREPGASDRRRILVGLTEQVDLVLQQLSVAHIQELRAIRPGLLALLRAF